MEVLYNNQNEAYREESSVATLCHSGLVYTESDPESMQKSNHPISHTCQVGT